jgi:hypothetical protein
VIGFLQAFSCPPRRVALSGPVLRQQPRSWSGPPGMRAMAFQSLAGWRKIPLVAPATRGVADGARGTRAAPVFGLGKILS